MSEDELIPIGMNSIFGTIPFIIEKTGLSYNQLMWSVSYTQIRFMLDDCLKQVKRSNVIQPISGRQLRNLFNG